MKPTKTSEPPVPTILQQRGMVWIPPRSSPSAQQTQAHLVMRKGAITQHNTTHKWTYGPTSSTMFDCLLEGSFPCNSVGMLFCGISPIIEWSFGRFGFSLTHARTNTQTRMKLHRFLGCILLQFRKHQKRKWTINGHPKWGEPTTPWKWRTMLKQHWNKYKQRSLDWNKTCEESTKGRPGTGDYTLPTLLECT